MAFSIPANFIGVFKIGDNINYNLEVLRVLYEQYNTPDFEYAYLIKPIVIINTSIIEAILYDFIRVRIQKASLSERIGNISHEVISAITSKKLDRFEHYISQVRIYDFFSLSDTNFYEAMNTLRKVRNRVHIQNEKWLKPENEDRLFNERIKVLSEKVLEKVLNTMHSRYQRNRYYQYVNDFNLPWDRHFPEPQMPQR